jgi:putative tryptophan/tyrosine transport system substrate-binding protein
MIDRRQIVALLGSAAAAWPFAASAQQPAGRRHRIGVLETIPRERNTANFSAFREKLRALGYVEGLTIEIDYVSADGDLSRFGSLAQQLVRSKADVIVTRGTPAVVAAKAATSTIPIVMAAIGDPLIVVSSLARPGGNITGLTSIGQELQGKRVEILREVLGKPGRVAALLNYGNPGQTGHGAEIEAATQALGGTAVLHDVRSAADIERAFASGPAERIDGYVVAIDGIVQANLALVVDLAARSGRPAIFAAREFVEAGGLMSYGVFYPDNYSRAATFVDKILKGAKPADIPVEQPTKFELVINGKTAKALGITIPPTLLAFATEVIE